MGTGAVARTWPRWGDKEGVCTHCGHCVPRPAGIVALVVVEPEGVAVPLHGPLHLHDHLLRPQGDLQPGHCAGGSSGHLAPGTTRPGEWHRALRPGGHPLPQHPPPRAPQGRAPRQGGSQHCQGRGMPAPTLALGDGSLCRRPRAVCGDKGSVGRGDRGRHSRARRGLTWHPLPLAQPLAAVRVGVCRDVELGAQRRLEAAEGHPALGRKTTTALR